MKRRHATGIRSNATYDPWEGHKDDYLHVIRARRTSLTSDELVELCYPEDFLRLPDSPADEEVS